MSAAIRRFRSQALIAAAVVAAGLALALTLTDVARDQELATVDARFSARGAEDPSDDVVIVRIDDVSFGALQERWPFPRSLHATVIDELRRAGAKVIAYDVQFTEPTKWREDAALMDAVGRAKGDIVLATSEVNEFGESAIFGSERKLRSLGGRSGNANLVSDSDGVVRRTPYRIEGMLAFPVAAVALARREPVPEDGFDSDGSAWIDLPGPPGTIPSVAFSDVHAGTVDPARFRGKIVVVGATAPSLQDNHPTSAGAEAPMAGVEVHAASIATLLDGVPLRKAPRWLELTLIVALAMAAPLLALALSSLRRRTLLTVVLTLLIAAGYLAVAQLAFQAGTILPVFLALAGLCIGLACALLVESLAAVSETAWTWKLFSRFLPQHVGEEVKQARDERDLRAEPKPALATVVICDLRDSTAFAEEHKNTWQPMCQFFELMTTAVERHGGEVVQYQGDGVLAVFDSEVVADHADRALAAARDMAGPALASFNVWLRTHHYSGPMRMGVGMDSGSILRGNVGGNSRLQYMLLGDTANTASRLESKTKDLDGEVVVSDRTYAMLKHQPPDLRYVDAIEVRGKQEKRIGWVLQIAAERPAERFRRVSVPD